MTTTLKSLNVTSITMAFVVIMGLVFSGKNVMGAPGGTITTPANPTELPVEIEVETGIASLKQAPLWKELVQLLDNPYTAQLIGNKLAPSTVVRRPGFGVTMPPLNVWPLNYNFLTGQPMRIKTSDGEVSWDRVGPLFDPDEVVDVGADPMNPNVPVEVRTKIGALVACSSTARPPGFPRGQNPCGRIDDEREGAVEVPDGWLVVHNPRGRGNRNFYGYSLGNGPSRSDSRIPPNGTIVALPAVVGGILYEGEIDPASGELELEPVAELEVPVNEEHFIKNRRRAEELGKALFWDMQVGSDGVQSCGTCHFHAGADSRTRNQLNPNHLGGDLELQVFNNRVEPQNNNQDVEASDFPFHKLADPGTPGEPLFQPDNVLSDVNDVMSSMGVSRFTLFDDVIVGDGAFGPAVMGVAPLMPDVGTPMDDPIPLMQGLRRVEPRNTPTMHAAAFNLDNFWDGRARFHFNGGSVFGQSDPFYHIYVNPVGGPLAPMTNPDPLQLESGNIADWVGGDEPVRIKFSSLASQAAGPPLSDFEMAFAGRNWPKIGKKMLQDGVTPLANQLVDIRDSRLGRWSNQGGNRCIALGRPTLPGMPGLCTTYPEMIRAAFVNRLWNSGNRHLVGTTVPMDNDCEPGEQIEAGMTPTCDPFDGYVLEVANGVADPTDTNQFTHMEANFTLFFGLAVQAYEELLIPDDTPFDRFMDANPKAANGVGQPGEQGVLFPTLVPGLVGNDTCPAGTVRNGVLCLIPDDPATPEYDGFMEEELLGFDVFAGANLTAALAIGNPRNPDGFGSNPFTRTSRCMLCHLGPEQTDHSINIAHGVIKGDAEYEYPTPPVVPDPGAPDNCSFDDCLLPAPEAPGPIAAVGGLVLTEEVAETPQDAVEVEPLNFNATGTLVERIIAAPSAFAFGDQGIYNVGLRPDAEDIGRGGDDAFGFPLALTALTLLNIGGEDYGLCDNPDDFAADANGCAMQNFNPDLGAGGGLFEETTSDQSINPGLEREPINPLLPEYLAEWVNAVPAGELHPQIDEMAGFAPNTITAPNGGPAIEFPENLFGADQHCGIYDPAVYGAGPPNFGWGPRCPNNQSGVPNNLPVENPVDLGVYVPGSLVAPLHGTWPFPNRLRRDGQFKAPQLRNVELTGPYFHTGSALTLRQVVDFYLRGGDFPETNKESRDQHMVDSDVQAFGFGTTLIASNGGDIPDIPFADALPDTAFQYDYMPDTGHAVTPEPAYMTAEFAAESLVRYLLSLTDPRVAYRAAPFDQPEIFVPVDGTAPENTGGRAQLLAAPALFRQVPATGRVGQANKLPNFLGISSTPVGGPDNDHFDR